MKVLNKRNGEVITLSEGFVRNWLKTLNNNVFEIMKEEE